MNRKSKIILLIGVSGCGKTTIGELLAKKMNVPFYDADDFHPKENVEKMKNGIPLNTKDRLPWLQVLAEKINNWAMSQGGILACSALKESYRKILSSKYNKITWVYLFGDYNIISQRLEKRKNHFMKLSLLSSQFEDLEVPNYGLHIDVKKEPQKIIDEILLNLKSYE